jgi:hypothetical protein
MWQAIAGLALDKVNGRKQAREAERMAEEQAKADYEAATKQRILDNREVAQQTASSIGLQGMDAERQAAYERQRQFFASVMNKYRIGGGVQNG